MAMKMAYKWVIRSPLTSWDDPLSSGTLFHKFPHTSRDSGKGVGGRSSMRMGVPGISLDKIHLFCITLLL